MKQIDNPSFYKLQREFHVIQEFELKRDVQFNYVYKYCLKICACDFKNTPQRLVIEFDGVSGLIVGDLNGAGGMYINIYDLSNEQTEDIKYKVHEEEENLFSFYCNSFSFKVEDI